MTRIMEKLRERHARSDPGAASAPGPDGADQRAAPIDGPAAAEPPDSSLDRSPDHVPYDTIDDDPGIVPAGDDFRPADDADDPAINAPLRPTTPLFLRPDQASDECDNDDEPAADVYDARPSPAAQPAASAAPADDPPATGALVVDEAPAGNDSAEAPGSVLAAAVQTVSENEPEGDLDSTDVRVDPLEAEEPLDAVTCDPVLEPDTDPDAVDDETPLPAETRAWDPAAIDPAVAVFHERFSAVCEQFRALRSRVQTLTGQLDGRVLSITSSVPQEGKSVIAANLGLVWAEGGEHSVLLVDADLRRGSLARMLGYAPAPGLAEVLRGEATLAEAARPTPFANLHVLTAGNAAAGTCSELLSQARTRTLFARWRRQFETVLVDCPPLTTVADVGQLAPCLDGALFVVRMGHTPEPVAQDAVRALQACGVAILGCVPSRGPERQGQRYDRYHHARQPD